MERSATRGSNASRVTQQFPGFKSRCCRETPNDPLVDGQWVDPNLGKVVGEAGFEPAAS